jgi:hypothetical protein
MRGRLTVVALLALCAGLLRTSARVAWLASGHAKDGDGLDLRERYERQHTSYTILSARRGDIFDCRGRPIALPDDARKRGEKLCEWIKTLNVYPEDVFSTYLTRLRELADAAGAEKGGQKRGGLFSRR